ncbi:hypothetical protein GCM10020367_42000 [Streptomyces sannanensis]|uniref:PDZ domain-containing protein n=1 Tax=Streptomyces sannanensis TaxID=285536 RepID=A0ABP6SFP1_9ACTN
MDEGKPTGPKPKWWSRPAHHAAGETELPPTDTPDAYPLAPPAPAVHAVMPTAQAAVPAQPQANPSAAPDSAPPVPPHVDSLPAPDPGDESVAVTAPVVPQMESPHADPATDPVTGTLPGREGDARPLHDPDPYSTPPYGKPGPWALAPPVQRPVPPQAPMQVPAAPQVSPWMHYDPWAAPGQQLPLTQPDTGAAPKRRRGALLLGAVLLALVAGGIGGGVGAYIERNGGVTEVELPQAGRESTGRAPDSVAGIAASALPSVVTLHVSGSGEQGTGTGFVLDTQGHILTNNHVVDPAGSNGDITVTFSSGETARAELVGKDSGYDLAVVKVKGVSGLKPLPLGNSDNVRVGDPVVAIGAPFDLQNTVTSGIISAKQRPITAGGEKGDGSDVSYVDALQTDAPINPGNSGGPLVDSKARVIGINSAIRAADTGSGLDGGGQGGSIGLGFAIPINQGKRVAEELISTGKATHPVIGVTLDMKFTGDGARVGTEGAEGKPPVTRGGPAAKAGIAPGDVITKVDGQRVHNGEELIVKIRAHRPGDRLELTVERGGKVRTLTLTLGSSDGT